MPAKEKMQLNKAQLDAIKHKSGPLLVVAGAGTGKTRVITERIKDLIEKRNVKPQEILALTFTEKAASEMLERIGEIMPLGYEEPWVYTFHSFADRILNNEGIEIGLDPSYKILAGPDQWLLLRKHIFELDLHYFRPLGNPTKFISAVLKFISRLQDENISPVEFKKFVKQYEKTLAEKEAVERWNELSYLYDKYQEMKIASSKLDFGDLITWTIKLFNERPNILRKYQEQFKHILIDEFQDTNYAQYELIKLLCPKEMKERSLIAVGDDSQSIYKFRGAAVSNILQFMEDYKDAKMVTLVQNYRSTQNILDPAYKLIQNNNPDTLESKLSISKKLVSEVEEQGNDPEIVCMDTLEDEVEFVVSKIYEILGKEPQYTYKDFAILARANNQLDPFLMALRKYGLPYQLVGNRGLYDRDEIRDILAFLRVIINPAEGINLYRVLNILTLEIPYDEISKLLARYKAERISFWEAVKQSSNEKVTSLCNVITNFQENITKATPTKFIYNLVNTINYLNQFLKTETVENQMSINNMNLFIKRVQKFEVDFHDETREMPTIIDLISYIDLMIEAGENPAQAEIEDIDTVNLMTVHASKGLEFPVVFMVNLVSDRFPTKNKKDIIGIPDELVKETLPTGDEHIQEERRLFYVGMTRAKKYLYMTFGKDYGGKRERIPSGYLNETKVKVQSISTEEIIKIQQREKKQETLFGMESGFRDPTAQKITDFAPSTLNYSQIDSYLTCPLQYKYGYVLKIPTAENPALSFGNSIHNSLRDYYYKLTFEKQATLEDLLKIYEKDWQPFGYLDEQHREFQFEQGKKLLTRYFEKNKDDKTKHLAFEKTFTLKIDGIRFNGRIDRIDELPDGSVEIIDYKTGTPKSQKDVDKDLQVSLYAIAAKEALGYDPKLLSLYFLEPCEKVSTTRTQEQLEERKKEVLEVVKKIRKGEFEANPGMHCNWCSFKDICPLAFKG
jgi:DNA helicase II / ATP-dependent DNA helicase PcrA